MYILGSRTGWHGQKSLWNLLGSGLVIVHSPNQSEISRMRALMEKYRDIPMDLADASLVAAAESRGLERIFTLDSDFRVYRFHGNARFDVVP
jgi:predicted nucleic acid-binding protein